MDDAWNSGAAYEPYIGRWSRLVARAFLAWLAVPPGRRWLDVGCGTGALCATILGAAEPSTVTGIDPSEGYIVYARSQLDDQRVHLTVGDAQRLPFPDAAFDATVSGLALNFVSRPDLAVAEMMRVTRPSGAVAAYVWDYAGEMQLIRHFWDAAVALDSAVRALDEGVRFPVCHPEPLRELFQEAGLQGIEVCPLDIPAVFRDFDDYWTPFLGSQGPAPGYAMSLDSDDLAALRERIRASLPVAIDGSITLIARAWAVRAMRP